MTAAVLAVKNDWYSKAENFTGSIARSAKRRYISYSKGNFELFRPIGCTDGVKFGTEAGAFPLRDFHEMCIISTSFQDALALKNGGICSRGYGVMGVLSWGGRVSPTFWAPPRGKFVVVHSCSAFSDSRQLATPQNAEVQKTAKFGGFRR